jgi:hypothetical protein
MGSVERPDEVHDGLLSPTVRQLLEALWPDTEARRQVSEALATYGLETYEQERERVQIAILKISDGVVAKVISTLEVAKCDYRDVLMWAEYPREGRSTWRLRPNLTQEEKDRIKEIRRTDRQEYEDWLKKFGR